MKHTLPSTSILEVTPLPYEKAWEVAQTVLTEVGRVEMKNLSGLNFEAILVSDVLEFKGPICALMASPAMLNAAKQCWVRATYNGLKIDDMTFDSERARGDFLPAAFYALKDNISPFFGSLFSLLKTS